MKYEQLIIAKNEYKKLQSYLDNAHYGNDAVFKRAIGSLKNELKTAKILKEDDMPNDVVRFYSKVTIELPNAVSKTYQIVSPDESNLPQSKISILSPMALALFGYSKTDSVEWQFPSGISTIQIQDVQQEENNSVKSV